MCAFKSLFLLAVFSQPFNIKASDLNVVLPIGGLFNKLSDDDSKQIFKDYGMKERSYFGHYINSNVTEDGYSTSLDVCDYTSHGSTLTAIIDARPSYGVCDNICLLCNKLNISHLSLAWEPIESASDTQFTLNYHPPPEVISKAYAAHIKKTDWDRFSILYEDDGSFIRLQEVINSWRTDLQPIHFKKLDPYGDNRETFKYIFKVARLSYHIIDCESENIVKYMKEILEIEQNTAYQTILLTSLDAYAVDLRDIDFNGNISTWHLTKPSQEFWSDQGIEGTPKLHTYLTVDALNHLENSIKAMVDNTEDGDDWIFDLPLNVPPALCYKNTSQEYVRAAWKYGPALRDALLQTTKSGLTGNIQFDENGKRTNFILHHSEFHEDISKFVHAGQWNSTTNKIEEFGKKPVKKTTHFKVITTITKPYYTPGVNGSEGTGYVVDLMEAIFKKINEQENLLYTYDISVGPNNKVGNPIEGSRRWDGLIGDIIERKADLAICDLTITSDRHAVVDFSIPFMHLGISMLFPVTPPPKPNMFSFVGPLATDVWLYLAVVYLFVSLVLLICARMSQDDWVNPHPCNQNPENLENIWSLYNCMWLTMGSIMTQGCDILPRGYGSRWIAGTWYFFALIVTASYTANMSTFISNNRREGKIEDIKALSEQKDISYGAMINGSTYKFFESSNDTVIQKLWHTMSTANPTVFTESNIEGKDRVVQSEKGEYVFFMESTTIEYFIKQDCRLKMVGSKLDSKEYGVAMPKNSPYKHYFNAAILSLQEKLDLQKIKEKWWVKDPDSPAQENCPEVDEDDSGSLKMKNTSGIFLVLGFGGILGLIIAIIGFLLHAHDICVTEKITYKEALTSEWKASLDPFALNKAAAPPRSAPPSVKSSCTPRERSKSRAVSVLRAAQSFINFDDIY